MDSKIVLVDDNNTVLGEADKLSSHHATTPLHRGFSVYVFNDKNEILVTQRALSKKVWPGVWTNTACGHPQMDESAEDAVRRRLQYELGLAVTDLQVILPDYRYKTPPFKGVIENELCPVFIARAASEPTPNPVEVEAVRWMSWADFMQQAAADGDDVYSYWCKDQLPLLAQDKKVLDFIR